MTDPRVAILDRTAEMFASIGDSAMAEAIGLLSAAVDDAPHRIALSIGTEPDYIAMQTIIRLELTYRLDDERVIAASPAVSFYAAGVTEDDE